MRHPLYWSFFSLSLFLNLATIDPLAATNYTIVTQADDNTTNGNCTLREAYSAAVFNSPIDACPAGSAVVTDSIFLTAGTYVLSIDNLEGAGGEETRIAGPPTDPPTAVISGGGIFRVFDLVSGAGRLTLENLEIREGHAAGPSPQSGAAVRVLAGSLTARHVRFFGNVAPIGGAIGFGPTGATRSLEIESCVFEQNRAEWIPAANAAMGGAIYAEVNPQVSVSVTDSRFEANRAESSQAGGFVHGGAVALVTEVVNPGPIVLARDRFVDNVAAASGADGHPGNAALHLSFAGGGFRFSDLVLANNRLEGPTWIEAIAIGGTLSNLTQGWIERLRLVGGDAARNTWQASLTVVGSTLRLENSLFEGADAQNGLNISSDSGATVSLDHLTVVGHVLEGLAASATPGVTFVIANSIAYGNGTDTDLTGTVELRPENLVGVDPLFTDSGAGDFTLTELSPAVDAGDSTSPDLGPYDLAHAARLVGPETDLGAYERGGIFNDSFESGSTGAWSW